MSAPAGSRHDEALTGALLPQHATLIAASAIAPAVVAARGYRSVTDPGELRRLGFAAFQCRVPALLVPGYGPDGRNGRYQLRPDTPRIGTNGRPIKYETPADAALWLDVPPPVQEQLADPTMPLWITEGARKADAAVSAGLCCISIAGVWSWRVLGDWAQIALKGRAVFVCFDSDVTSKPEVRQALAALAAFLTSLGAHVRVVQLPPGAGGAKVGLDDFFAAGHTHADLEALARPVADLTAHDDVDELARLREANATLRAQNAALQREAARAHEHDALVRRALANRHVRVEAATALATIDAVAEGQERGRAVDGWVRIHPDAIARAAGVNRQSVGRHLRRLAALGVLEYEARTVATEMVDARGRCYRPKQVWVRIDTKREAERRLAYAQPVEEADEVQAGRARAHGKKRLACPEHGEVRPVRRLHCPHCDVVLHEAQEVEHQPLDHQRQEVDVRTCTTARCATPVRCTACGGPTATWRPVCLPCQAGTRQLEHAAAARDGP